MRLPVFDGAISNDPLRIIPVDPREIRDLREFLLHSGRISIRTGSPIIRHLIILVKPAFHTVDGICIPQRQPGNKNERSRLVAAEIPPSPFTSPQRPETRRSLTAQRPSGLTPKSAPASLPSPGSAAKPHTIQICPRPIRVPSSP